MKRSTAAFLLISCSFVWLSGCAKPTPTIRKAPFTTLTKPQAGLPPDQEKARDTNCFEGCPVLSTSAGYGPTAMVYRKGYVLQHSSIDRIPIWVAEHVGKNQLTGTLERDDSFAPDPL